MVSTMGLPFFYHVHRNHTQRPFLFSQTMADYYQGLGLTFSHCVDVWVCIELWRWGNILSIAALLMFVALKPRMNIDIMANFGLWYSTSWYSREVLCCNIRFLAVTVASMCKLTFDGASKWLYTNPQHY